MEEINSQSENLQDKKCQTGFFREQENLDLSEEMKNT